MSHMFQLMADSAWKVLIASVLLGAGLPAIFALGIRSLAFGTGGSAEVDSTAAPHPIGKIAAAICFAAVLGAIALGITIIVASGFGKVVTFDHIFPMIVDKKK